MAVNLSNRPFLGGLRPTRGMLRIVLLRWTFALLTSLPAVVASTSGIAREAARRPYYTDVKGPLPVVHLLRFLNDLPGALFPAVIASVLLAILADQFLTAGALALLDPERPADERRGVFATMAREGLAHLYPFLRVALAGGLLFVLGEIVIVKVADRIANSSESGGATLRTVMLLVPLTTALCSLLWFSLVGTFVLWCRLLTVADGRRRVRRTGLLVLGVFRRRPARALVLPALLLLAAAVLPGVIPIAWRLSAPATTGAVLGWVAAWLLALFAQAFVWQWVLRAGRLLYAAPELEALRRREDARFGLLERLRGLFRRDRRVAAEAPSTTPAP